MLPNQSSNQSTNQPPNQQSNKATERPTNQSTDQPTNHSTNQPPRQSTTLPINQSTNQPVNQLISYLLFLADNALIIGHRNSQWCGHGPVLEQDIALTNIALDQIGQARYFYQYAAELTNQLTNQPVNQSTNQPTNQSTEDTLAYLRDTRAFKNCLLVEQRNGDWGKTIARQFLFSAYQYFLYRQLQNSKDERIAAISARSLKETTYHLRWSSEWVIRLGDGTKESHSRMTTALDELWPYTAELFTPVDYEKQMWEEGIGANCTNLHDEWQQKVQEVLAEAGLSLNNVNSTPGGLSGKEGIHTEHLGCLLAEMQFLQRAYPDCSW